MTLSSTTARAAAAAQRPRRAVDVPIPERSPADLAIVLPLCRLVVDFRLAAAILTLVSLVAGRATLPVVGGVAAAAVASFLTLRHWERVAPLLVAHPALLGLDGAVSIGVLAATGATSPWLFATLCTAALAGALLPRAGAALLTALLLLGYYLVTFSERSVDSSGALTFQVFVGLPALYPLAAAGARALRRTFADQAAAASEARAATALATAAEERARFAREMHDSVAKTLHGLSLSAAGLANWVQRSPEHAVRRANELAAAARTASAEARALIGDLRADAGEQPIDEVVRRIVTDWAAQAEVACIVDLQPVALDATSRYELLCVLREALHNVGRHAAARSLAVSLQDDGRCAELVVRDNGAGFSLDDRTEAYADTYAAWQRRGHYGLVGMAERAARAGGTLTLESEPGVGTTVRLVVPTGAVTPASVTPAAAPRPGRTAP